MSELLEEIQRRAAGYDPVRLLLLLLAVPLLAVGWLAGLVVRTSWIVLAWLWAACVEGYRRGRGET